MKHAHQREAPLRIGELARLAGTSPDTLRHYERIGVLQPPLRGANGYRLYPPSALARVRVVKRALAVGFTLEELARVLAERDAGGAPCREVRALAAEKLVRLDAWLEELSAVRDRLGTLLEEWDGTLAKTPSRRRARLLEALGESDEPFPDAASVPPLRRRAPRSRDEAERARPASRRAGA